MADRLSLRERARGALVGLAVGDLAGARTRNPRVIPVWRLGKKGTTPGTDVTEMMVELAASIVDAGGYDDDAALARYQAWFDRVHVEDGHAVRHVLKKLRPGDRDAWDITEGYYNFVHAAAGNRGLARCAPIALRYARDPDAIASATRTDSDLTHYGGLDLPREACVAFNLLLADTLLARDTVRDDIDEDVGRALGADRDAAFAIADDEHQARFRGQEGSPLAALALAAAARTAGSFQEAMTWVVGAGGDAHVNGAVAGALLGARMGERGIPAAWRKEVEWHTAIVDLAGTLIQAT